MNREVWDEAFRFAKWFDQHSSLPPEAKPMARVMKLTEETGEAAQALIGVMGENPRKGITHSWEDVAAELCDVIFTAMVALVTITPDAERVFGEHLAFLRERADSRRTPSDPAPRECPPSRAGPASNYPK